MTPNPTMTSIICSSVWVACDFRLEHGPYIPLAWAAFTGSSNYSGAIICISNGYQPNGWSWGKYITIWSHHSRLSSLLAKYKGLRQGNQGHHPYNSPWTLAH